jgi:lipoprotein Spr
MQMPVFRILIATLLLFSLSCGNRKTATKKPSTIFPQEKGNDLGVTIQNPKLKKAVTAWLNTPYQYNGNSKNGIDCSHFTCEMLRVLEYIPADFYTPSNKLAEKAKKIDFDKLEEGDLIFFSIAQNGKISHVGIYLSKDKFVHASTSKGVIISSLEDKYYKPRIAFYGRIR